MYTIFHFYFRFCECEFPDFSAIAAKCASYTQTIVICFRGTQSIADCVTDGMAAAVPWDLPGHGAAQAHAGILAVRCCEGPIWATGIWLYSIS